MVTFIVGLLLFLAPFLLVCLWSDRRLGFVSILFLWLGGEALLAIMLQSVHWFAFWPLFLCQAAVAAGCIWLFWKKRPMVPSKPDFFLLFVLLVSILSLIQVHYYYSGKFNIATDQVVGYHDATGMRYSYPYFSDEWDAISLIQYSIDTHSLPLVNPLNGEPFVNFALPFYSFLAGCMLLLGLSPVTSFTAFALGAGVLLVVLAYLFISLSGLKSSIAAITALSVLFIASGSNLPGLWYLLPVQLGVLFYLIGLCFMTAGKTRWANAAGAALACSYPPLIVFYGLSLFVYLLQDKTAWNWKKVVILFSGLVGVILLLGVLLLFSPLASLLMFKLVHLSFTAPYMPQYVFYQIIPVWCLFLLAIGIDKVMERQRWLMVSMVLGASFWVLYVNGQYRMIIEYERVVFITAILLILASAWGLDRLFSYVEDHFEKTRYPLSRYLAGGAMLLFVLQIPWYTAGMQWQSFSLVNPQTKDIQAPKAPANTYLVADDLKLFSGISGKYFLSVPWKGLVVGTATKNYPVLAKEGTLSVGDPAMLFNFMNGNCQQKTAMAKRWKLDYIYLLDFWETTPCPGFAFVGENGEGFRLFKVTN